MKVSPHRLTRARPCMRAFMVWLGLVTGTRPRAHPAPYLPHTLIAWVAPLRAAVPPYISGRTSYLRVRLEFLPYPQVIPPFCNTGGFGPRRGLTPASPCPWVAHPVSGLIPATPARPLQTPRVAPLAFAPAPRPSAPLNLRRSADRHAAEMNSPDHSTKGTPSARDPGRTGAADRPRLLVGAGFQALFHPPRGVLFTFPSRYSCAIGGQAYDSLGGWSPLLPAGLLVSRGTRARGGPVTTRRSPTGLSPAPARLPSRFGSPVPTDLGSPPAAPHNPDRPRRDARFGPNPFRSPLLRASHT
jgi:hypothetical protein